MACVCDQFSCTDCCRAKLFTGIDSTRFPDAFRLGESADPQMAKPAKWAWKDRKRAHKITEICIEQEYQAALAADDVPLRSKKLSKPEEKVLEAKVSSETVLPILRRNCGEDWVVNTFGVDEAVANERTEKVIVNWLKAQLGVEEKSTRKKKGLAVDLHKQWDRGAPRLFQSQRVIARWSDDHGNVSAAPWNGHYKAQVVGDAAVAGQYRLLFDAHLGPNGEHRAAQEHPCVPIRQIDRQAASVWEGE